MPEAWLDNLRVVLVRSRNPLNIGAAARAMSNFGFTHLRLVTPWEPSYLGAKAAVGASEVLLNSELPADVSGAVSDCGLVVGTTAVGEREVQHPLHALEEGARRIREAAQKGPVALMFGSEKNGLANSELSHCHFLMRIPTRVEHISMNLGQAVAICMYELARGTQAAPLLDESQPAPAGQVELLTQLLGEALSESGYQHGTDNVIEQEKLRRMVRRLGLEKSDAEVMLGMLRQMLWKMRH